MLKTALIHEHLKHFHNKGTLKQTSTPFQISTSEIPSKLPPLLNSHKISPPLTAGGGSNEQNIFPFNFATRGGVICLLLLLMDAQTRQQRKKGAKKLRQPPLYALCAPQTLVHFWFAAPFANSQKKASKKCLGVCRPHKNESAK
jgi:hypothetical protein